MSNKNTDQNCYAVSAGNAISLESIQRQSLKFTMNASVICYVRHISHYQIKC